MPLIYSMLLRSLLPALLAIKLTMLQGCAAPAPNIDIPLHEPISTHLNHIRPQVILVLGSGSARGFSHAGVLKVLEANHIPIDMIIGTSAGSIVGALYADHPSAIRLEKLFVETSREEVIDFSLMNIANGPISGNQLQNFLLKNMRHHTFDKLPIPFTAVATDFNTGKIHIFKSGFVAPAVNASSAVPGAFRPVQLYGKTFVDGGILDPVPVDVAKRYNPKIIIAVSLDSSLSNTLTSSTPSVLLRSVQVMLNQLNNYSVAQADIIIRPEELEISMFDGSRRRELIYAGEVAAKKVIPQIKALLLKNNITLKK